MQSLAHKALMLFVCLITSQVAMALTYIPVDQISLESAQRHEINCPRLPFGRLQIFDFSTSQTESVVDKLGNTNTLNFRYIICSGPRSRAANCTTENLIRLGQNTQLTNAFMACFDNFIANQQPALDEEADYDYEGMTTAP